jgi:uncharacterized oxidoreductase
MVALFGSLLGGLGIPDGGEVSSGGGSSLIVIDIGALAPMNAILGQVGEAVRWVKDTRPMEGSSGVLYPGEIEENNRQERLAQGVEIEQATWDAVVGLVKEHGLEEELGPLP